MACLFCTTCLQLQTLFQRWFQKEIRACKKGELCGWSVVIIRVDAYMYYKTIYAFTPNLLISDFCHWNWKPQIVYYSKEIIIIVFLMRYLWSFVLGISIIGPESCASIMIRWPWNDELQLLQDMSLLLLNSEQIYIFIANVFSHSFLQIFKYSWGTWSKEA